MAEKCPDAITRDMILEFAKTKPPGEAYVYINPWNCPIAQMLRGMGYNVITGGPDRAIVDFAGEPYTTDIPINNGVENALKEGKETYGALVERLENI